MNEKKPFLTDDIARCSGLIMQKGEFFVQCETCARRLAPANSQRLVVMPTPTFVRECDLYIPV